MRPVAGVAVAAFGLVNAVAIMASATFMATAAAVAETVRWWPEATRQRPSGCCTS